jgi:hypothetical protein
VEYGDPTWRWSALQAFNGKRQPLTLDMTRYTTEGTPIAFTLEARQGLAVLRVDERLDGGPLRTDTLTKMVLVRYVPSRWLNNVEIEKEKFELVNSLPPKDGVYLLVDAECLTGPCTRLF